ncbi:cyclopropane-fatty-acyl-phospholipid synthase, partial [Colletotrichum salicis]
MADEKRKDGAQLEGDITFIATPAAKPSTFNVGEDCGVKTTN